MSSSDYFLNDLTLSKSTYNFETFLKIKNKKLNIIIKCSQNYHQNL